MSTHSLSIGIFDSGVGGLTVMRSLLKAFPQAQFFYFGDTANLPYGNKPRSLIAEYCKENGNFLVEKGIQLFVIACHTISTNAFEEVKKHFSLPVIGMVDATLAEIDRLPKKNRIALLATENSIASGIYQKLIQAKFPQTKLFPIACPQFVPLIEQGKKDDPLAKLIVHETLKGLAGEKIDAVVLACTHFPIITHLIRQELGSDVVILDPADAIAREVQNHLPNLSTQSDAMLSMEFYLSKVSPLFPFLAESLLNLPVNQVFIHSPANQIRSL